MSNDENWKKFLKDDVYLFVELFFMKFFVLNGLKYLIVYIVNNMFNNELKFYLDLKIGFGFIYEFLSINKNKIYGF